MVVEDEKLEMRNQKARDAQWGSTAPPAFFHSLQVRLEWPDAQ
jgi:hypothetical protein